MKERIKKQSNNQGFTLIELLVAMTTFSVVMIAVADIFLTGIGGTQRIFGSQVVQETGRFIMESVAKEIRMGSVDSLGGTAYSSLPDGASGPYDSLAIVNTNGQTVSYVFDPATGQISRSGAVLNSSDVEVSGKFYLIKNDNLQPRLTLVLGLVNRSAKAKNQSTINLQTSVSSRDYRP